MRTDVIQFDRDQLNTNLGSLNHQSGAIIAEDARVPLSSTHLFSIIRSISYTLS